MKILKFFPVILLMAACATTRNTGNISKVEFKAGACFGTCPIFSMTIRENGEAIFDAKRFNDITGGYHGTIKKAQLDSLFSMIRKADLLSLENDYKLPITDMPGYTLSVQFKDGISKTITDYGPAGPDNLKKIYAFISSLRGSQDWQKQQ